MRKVALIDWDGTIRKDFTIRTWIDFLVRHSIFSASIIAEIKEVFTHLATGKISHDDTSRYTTAIYAQYLSGHCQEELREAASLFMKEDSQYLCSFSTALFSFLAHNDIEVVVVSGAPNEVLLEYQRIFPIAKIYALSIDALDGKYLNKVSTNYGVSQAKHTIVSHFVQSTTHKVVFAAGNSSSDLPLLNAAPVSIIVGNPSLVAKSKYLHLSCDDDTDEKRMLSFLESEVIMRL